MRRLARKLLLGFLLIILTIGGVSTFRIKNIECRLDNQVCAPETLSSFEVFKNRSFFFSNVSATFAENSSLSQYQVIKVKKKLPGTLFFELKPYLTAYQLKFENEEKTYTVDFQQVLTEQSNAELPSITSLLSKENLLSEGKINSELHQSLTQLITAVKEHELSFEKITLENEHVIRISLTEGINGIISTDTIQGQIARLAFIQKNVDLASFDQNVQVIDVRYRLPVLRTVNTW